MIDWQLLAKEVHQANTDPMARDGNIYLQYGIMYVISDVCRMMEAGMDSRYAMEIASCDYEYDYAYALSYEYCIQGTLEGELADVAIRLLDLIAWGGGLLIHGCSLTIGTFSRISHSSRHATALSMSLCVEMKEKRMPLCMLFTSF